LSVNGALALSGISSFTVNEDVSVATTKTNADLEFNIPAANDQTWTDFTASTGAEGEFIIDDAIAITLANNNGPSSAVNGNTRWTNLTNVTLNSGTTINANGKGCSPNGSTHGSSPNSLNVCTFNAAGSGQGGASSSQGAGGAGHGGAGGAGNSQGGGSSFDSSTAPVLFGASGGSQSAVLGGFGGGAVRIVMSGTFTMNGAITANATNGTQGGSNQASGGGAGGTITITAPTVTTTAGTPSFSATGGNGGKSGTASVGGGGGGGRIAILYNTDTFGIDATDFTMTGGTAGAAPPTGVDGAKGTVYVNDNAGTAAPTDDAVKIFHGFGYIDTDYTVASWTTDPSATNQYCDPTIASVATPSVTTTGALVFGGTLSCTPSIASFNWSAGTSFAISSNAVMTVSSTGSTVDFNIPAGNDQTWTNFAFTGGLQGLLTIDDAAAVTLAGTTSILANVRWTGLTNLTENSGTTINANGKGCSPNGSTTGSAPSSFNVCTFAATGSGVGGAVTNGGAGGAGHGGAGGAGNSNAGGATYDSSAAPVLYGASGGSQSAVLGGAGGGLIRISLTGTFTHDGVITATGGAGTSGGASQASGGGAGGSIYVSTITIAT
jgi:hypothetical protein